MNAKEYLADPCKASSLPFWKAETINIPEHMKVLRDDEFSNCKYDGFDDQYFRLIHDLKNLKEAVLPDSFELVQCEEKSFAEHINSCYEHEHMSIKEMLAYKSHPVYDPDLWVSVIESDSKKIVATGIAELDTRIGEGVLEWIQVSSDYRKLGLGKYIVCELLIRLENKADFVTVSGRVANKSNPYALYKSCGFVNPVIWHVVTT
ncbi:GNAT family N-acetyltransferase [Butyrivibrio sp. FC2001]|uniref:GNAT family N-acetyltransferase n=1 Tax=Butyrivibrio sp. FC2001 TaxID=1280671 RepID=UPI000407AB6C|nr:GNAT family N-acetyltransferase [Butyrivibrio sp. FC2001]